MDGALTQALALLALSCLWTLVYWRPRRKIWAAARLMPGPKPLPLIGNVMQLWTDWQKLFDKFKSLHAEYGTVMRVWMGNQLSVFLSDPADIQCVLGNARVKNRDANVTRAIGVFTGTGLLSNKDEVWKTHRQLTTPMFHFKVLESYVEIFRAKSAILMDKLDEVADGRTFDVYRQLSLCTLDSICETAIGQPMNTQAEGWSELQDKIFDTMELVLRHIIYPWLHVPWLYAHTADGRRARDIIKKNDEFCKDVIARKLAAYRAGDRREGIVTASGKTITSFLDMLIEGSEKQGSVLTEQEMQDEILTMALAGLETTGVTMSALLLLIAIHPEWQEALYAEMSQVFADDMKRPATHQDLPKMPVLDRVVRETLRMFPAAGMISREISEDIALPSGYTLPAGSSVIVINYVVHRDARNYPEPNKFLPDRWLADSGSDRHQYAYLPFSAGPRICIGMKYALLQMKTILCLLVRRFKVTTDFTMEDMEKLHVSVSLRLGEDGYRLQLQKRTENDDQLGCVN